METSQKLVHSPIQFPCRNQRHRLYAQSNWTNQYEIDHERRIYEMVLVNGVHQSKEMLDVLHQVEKQLQLNIYFIEHKEQQLNYERYDWRTKTECNQKHTFLFLERHHTDLRKNLLVPQTVWSTNVN